ncbi:Membrane protein [Rhodovulum sp. P5]|uniref:DMT family transporter n=1 Tax=Rhodovulum sp. P5 TaxID=1564506 RepID=UPI0009C29D1D|nr:DMT family transporter [Rhodovulum sp. P5]ARE41244.1 Membrane protein [Rhodovulum sp. P5]
MGSSNLRGAVLALTGFAIYSLHDAIIKALGAHYHPVQIVFFSVLLGFPLILLMLIRQREVGSLRPVRPGWTALRMGAIMIHLLCVFYAFATIPITQVYALIFAMPLLITALSVPILGEHVGPRRWAAVVVGLLGVLIVLRPFGATDLTLGHLSALVGALSGSLVAVVMRKIGQEERSVVMLLYPMLGNVFAMGLLLPLVYQPMPILHFGALALVSVGALVAMSFMIAAYRAGEAVVVAPMQYSQMLWAVVLGYVFFAEVPDTGTALGSAVIVASGLIVLLREGKPDVSRTQPALTATDRPGIAPDPALLSDEDPSV